MKYNRLRWYTLYIALSVDMAILRLLGVMDYCCEYLWQRRDKFSLRPRVLAWPHFCRNWTTANKIYIAKSGDFEVADSSCQFMIENWSDNFFVKFIYSEKATKFCKIFTLLLSYVVPVKSKMEILQNFVAFWEYMNFNIRWFCMNCLINFNISFLEKLDILRGYDSNCWIN